MVAVVCAGLFPTHAQTGKPTRPFEFAVHTGPGGGDDVFARAIANMTEQEKLLPVRVQVVKKPGGNSIAGMVDAAERNGESNTIAVLANTWVTAPMTSAETKCSAVESRPGVDSGAWVFRGPRVLVAALFENLEGGASVAEFVEWFPGVTVEQAKNVLEHVAHGSLAPA